ncbi:MAG: lysophospholipid acyltransferase family protein [Bryobacteraceae bacterium]|nr:lysophospholipid acyltransferase family protein [Bryobacteraceae bacterium]
MARRSSVRNWGEYLAARAVLANPGLAGFAVRMLDGAAPRLRRVGVENLRAAGLPESLVDGVFENVARVVGMFARFPRVNAGNVREFIRYDGFEHYEEAKRRGRGVLIATAHLGNWEFSAFAHALMTEPMWVMVRPLDNPLIDAMVARYRSMSGNRVVEKKEFLRGVLKALKRNEAVGILIDQNAAEDAVFVDFFGRKAAAAAGFARLAHHTGATVLPGYALWNGEEGRYVLRFDAPVEMTGDVQADTQRLHSHLEEVIRRHPDQWLWIHRRWKSQPEG